MNYEFWLPWPPTVNNYYVKTQRGVFISQKGRKYRSLVAESIIGQMPNVHIEDRMLIEIIMYPPDNRKRDLDNYKKAMFDACTEAGLWADDSLIDQDFTYRGEVAKPSGSVFIRISEAGPVLPKGYRLP